MNEINLTLGLQIKDGPKFPYSATFFVEAYDKIDIDVAANEWTKVSIQPGTLEEIDFLLVVRNDKVSQDLYYQVNDDPTEIMLYSIHSLIGRGASGLLKAAPLAMKFKTDGDKPGNVTVLIGRKAADVPAPAAPPAAAKTAKSKASDSAPDPAADSSSAEGEKSQDAGGSDKGDAPAAQK